MTETLQSRERPDQVLMPGFRHEAFFYEHLEDFAATVAAFVEAGVAAGEPVMVALPGAKLALLRDRLGDAAEHVEMLDMEQIGRNPARIIPAWRDFVRRNGGGDRRLRGVGEPIWSGRSDAELVECQLHESLLNPAFSGSADMWLLCPYDLSALSSAVVLEARRSHPFVAEGGATRPSPEFRDVLATTVLDTALPEPAGPIEELAFDADTVREARRLVSRWATELSTHRAADFVLAVHEIATNSVRHGGGSGRLRCWRDGDSRYVCEVTDRGRIERPLLGRQLPPADDEVGRGMWLANQLCDLVQVRSSPAGSAVRLHISAH